MKISTKNLYLVTLKEIEIKYEDLDYITTIETTKFSESEIYTFAKLTKNNTYKDIFTGTEYLHYTNPTLISGSWCAYSVKTLVLEYRYVSKKILIEVLKQLNSEEKLNILENTSPRKKIKEKKKTKNEE